MMLRSIAGVTVFFALTLVWSGCGANGQSTQDGVVDEEAFADFVEIAIILSDLGYIVPPDSDELSTEDIAIQVSKYIDQNQLAVNYALVTIPEDGYPQRLEGDYHALIALLEAAQKRVIEAPRYLRQASTVEGFGEALVEHVIAPVAEVRTAFCEFLQGWTPEVTVVPKLEEFDCQLLNVSAS